MFASSRRLVASGVIRAWNSQKHRLAARLVWYQQQLQQQQNPFIVLSTTTGAVRQQSSILNSTHNVSTATTSPTTVADANSTTTTTNSTNPANTNTTNTNSSINNNSNTNSNKNSNVFLDNLGTIFLTAIGGIVAWLIRSYINAQTRNALRDAVECTCPVDPIELDDVRLANNGNPNLGPDAFTQLLRHPVFLSTTKEEQQQPEDTFSSSSSGFPTTRANQQDCHGRKRTMSYPEFVQAVRTALRQISATGTEEDATTTTVQLGHILDRIAMAAVLQEDRSGKLHSSPSSTVSTASELSQQQQQSLFALLQTTPMPVQFWWTLLSLALTGSARDRMNALFEMLLLHKDDDDEEDDTSSDNYNARTTTAVEQRVSMDQVEALVGYLQRSGQLAPDAQIVATSQKVPLQQYAVGTPKDLLLPLQETLLGNESNDTAATSTNDNNNSSVCSNRTMIDKETFATILRSKSVCAWGECYRKTKH